jgi:hypothetical protein
MVATGRVVGMVVVGTVVVGTVVVSTVVVSTVVVGNATVLSTVTVVECDVAGAVGVVVEPVLGWQAPRPIPTTSRPTAHKALTLLDIRLPAVGSQWIALRLQGWGRLPLPIIIAVLLHCRR